MSADVPLPSHYLPGVMRWKSQGEEFAYLEECAQVNLLTGAIEVDRPARAAAPLGFWFGDVCYDVEEIQDFSAMPSNVRTLAGTEFLVKHAQLRAQCRRDVLEHALDNNVPGMLSAKVRL